MFIQVNNLDDDDEDNSNSNDDLLSTLYGVSVVMSLPANPGDASSSPRSGRCARKKEGNGNLSQYSCLGNPMDRGA